MASKEKMLHDLIEAGVPEEWLEGSSLRDIRKLWNEWRSETKAKAKRG